MVNWTTIDALNSNGIFSITRGGLNLIRGQAYYIVVGARNAGGLWSADGVSGVVLAGVLSNNANLSGLALSSGTLTPAFVSNTTSYAASVANGVSSVVVTPTRSDANAAVVVANASGVCAQNRCSLIVGTNRITTTVTAQDGVTKKAYVVVVTRR